MARKLTLRATNHWPNTIADIIAEYSAYTIEEKVNLAISKPANAEYIVNTPDLQIYQFNRWNGSDPSSGEPFTIVGFSELNLSWAPTKAELIRVISMQSWVAESDPRRPIEPKILGALNAWMDSIQ